MMDLRIGARIAITEAEGPGLRYALWLQGCSIRCRGCCNPHFFDPTGGQRVASAKLLEEIASVREHIEGMTVLGGEPFEQASGLVGLAQGVQALGLSVIVFTGYTLEHLRQRPDPAVERLLNTIDVLVDGPYDAALPEGERLWVGSRNQRFHYLTNRYDPAIERAGEGSPWRTVEVRIRPDGFLQANGWPALMNRRDVR